MTGESDDGRDLGLLIPFYINGTLDAVDRQRLEQALAIDPALRAELKASQSLAALVRDGGAALAPERPASETRLEALLDRIPARGAPDRRARRAQARHAPLRPFRMRISWKVAFAASAALVLAQAGVIAWQAARQDEPYKVLSGWSAETPTRGQLIVAFSRDARWSDVESMLTARRLEIVGGPRGGAFDIALPADASLADELRWLRASPLVVFAGPAAR